MNLDFIKEIFAPQLKFEGIDESDKFARFFANLYRIELFKDGLDLILTKVRQRDLLFEVHLVKGWDTNLGCYLTEQSRVFNKVSGVFNRKIKKKIILKSFSVNVLAHEMAHALEFESEINLEKDGFRKAIGFDMKGRKADFLPLRGEIKRLMVDALKAYPQHQFISELFARYFELLSISKNVNEKGAFETAQVMDFFANSTKFVGEIFNPQIRYQIDDDIAKKTLEIAKNVVLEAPKTHFQDGTGSFFKQKGEDGKKSWMKNVKSNAGYQLGWQQYQKQLEDKKD